MARPDDQLLGEGITVDGERWQLTVHDGPEWPTATVHVTAARGYRYTGIGCGLADTLPAPVSTTTGGADVGPRTLLLQLRSDVRAAVVSLSDGTREDLRLHPLPGRTDRLAVLVHPRGLDVHRIDLYDATGVRFPDPEPAPDRPISRG